MEVRVVAGDLDDRQREGEGEKRDEIETKVTDEQIANQSIEGEYSSAVYLQSMHAV